MSLKFRRPETSIAHIRGDRQNAHVWLWLTLGATIVIPFARRLVLLREYELRRWAANLAAIGFLPGIALAGCTIAIASMTQQEKIDAGMAMIFPLFVVGVPFVAALVAVTVAEFMEHIG